MTHLKADVATFLSCRQNNRKKNQYFNELQYFNDPFKS